MVHQETQESAGSVSGIEGFASQELKRCEGFQAWVEHDSKVCNGKCAKEAVRNASLLEPKIVL